MLSDHQIEYGIMTHDPSMNPQPIRTTTTWLIRIFIIQLLNQQSGVEKENSKLQIQNKIVKDRSLISERDPDISVDQKS
jgi:hypothetical protein